MKLLLVVNVDWFFLSHRLPIALEAIRQGWEVYVLASDTGRKKEIESYGIHFIHVPFKRSGKNPFHELRCIYQLCKFYRKLDPTIIHHVTLKASLLGSIAAKISHKKAVINAISGFGYNFTDGRNGILQKIIKWLMNIAFKSNTTHFILQNPDDLKQIKDRNYVPDKNLILIKGSGVSLKEFSYTPPIKKDKVYILFPARILYDKGIRELLSAAYLFREKLENKATFILAGDCDDENITSVKEKDLKKKLIPGYIEWIGFRKDIIEEYKKSDIVVLPSYREGMPKSLIEAAAIGRPIITTDATGCKECVMPNYNGIIVKVKSVDDLAEAIYSLVLDGDRRIQYGKNSRTLAEKEFSIDSVLQKTFELYHRIKK